MVSGLGRATRRDYAGSDQIRFGQDAERNGLAPKCRGILAALQGREGTGAFPAIVTAKTPERRWPGSNGEDPRDAEAETAEQGLGLQNPSAAKGRGVSGPNSD